MAYKSYAKRRPIRRSYKGKRRSAPRRSYAKKRSTFRSKKMSKKRILNITSEKKRDTMLNWTNSSAATQVGGATYVTDPAIVTGGTSSNQAATFLWCATARDNTVNSTNNIGTKFASSTRTSSSPYMVGLKESIEIQCNTGMPWQWRRICFTMKGLPLVPNSTVSGNIFSAAMETSNGWTRVMNQVLGNSGADPMYTLYAVLFKGQVNSDWTDPFTAATDNNRVTIKYDKTITLASGNEDGFIRRYDRWHPMRKTLVYDDDETGNLNTAMNAAIRSVEGKAGMGDYYVMDMFRARQGSAATDQLSVRPEATLYWHEK
ncbi:capsid protein [Peromfec virus RodF5_34]|uniref:Capsid protein n=1 Tax=Peromfec virus RodF5_34 TaxID=2929284 RepID=A0A976N330_9VIRU|nr:capsid protein [Peromfec virus RodF5_34]